MSEKKIGLVAGEGALPRAVTLNAQREGYSVYALAVNWRAYWDLGNAPDKLEKRSPVRLAETLNFFHRHGVQELVIIGKLHKLEALAQIPFLDSLARQYLRQMVNFEDNTFHSMLLKVLQDAELRLLPQSRFLQDQFVAEGHFTQRALTESEAKDLAYGIELATKASQLEVSQTVIVKDCAVMALEAVEGTDPTIARGCRLARQNAVVVKVPWSKQSEYFDIPTVGPRTVQNIARHGGSVLAIKAGQTFVIEQERTIDLANRRGVAFLSF